MATKRKTFYLRQGDIIDVEEHHDGRYGAKGEKRQAKKKPTKEQMQEVNRQNRARKCRRQMLEYINKDDYFGTWTYRVDERPEDMKLAIKQFAKAIRKVRDAYRKQGYELFWFKNIERGTRGAWHIHFVMTSIPGGAQIIMDAWPHGATYIDRIKSHDDDDFTRLASYMTKDEKTTDKKKDGTPAKPRLKEASYNTSRNMPLPDPGVDKLKRWKREVKPKKGYYIANLHEGINPVTGYKYRRYTMIRLERRKESESDKRRYRKDKGKRRKGKRPASRAVRGRGGADSVRKKPHGAKLHGKSAKRSV